MDYKNIQKESVKIYKKFFEAQNLKASSGQFDSSIITYDKNPDPMPEYQDSFVRQKQFQSEQFSKLDTKMKKMEDGTVEALASQSIAIRKRKRQARALRKDYKDVQTDIGHIISDLNTVCEKTAKLKKKQRKNNKVSKDLKKDMDKVKQILILLCECLDISDRKTTFDELVPDLKCYRKQRRK